jgi:pSer/pThr/pTyr-binding forkhead associated (FHA) protein
MGKRHLMAKSKRAMYVLEAMNGPLDGKRWEFDRSIVVGRDASAAQASLPLDHAVSRRHAQIDVAADSLLISDLGSSNGTILRGDAIASQMPIEPGEPFVIGRTMFRVLSKQACQPPS